MSSLAEKTTRALKEERICDMWIDDYTAIKEGNKKERTK